MAKGELEGDGAAGRHWIVGECFAQARRRDDSEVVAAGIAGLGRAVDRGADLARGVGVDAGLSVDADVQSEVNSAEISCRPRRRQDAARDSQAGRNGAIVRGRVEEWSESADRSGTTAAVSRNHGRRREYGVEDVPEGDGGGARSRAGVGDLKADDHVVAGVDHRVGGHRRRVEKLLGQGWRGADDEDVRRGVAGHAAAADGGHERGRGVGEGADRGRGRYFQTGAEGACRFRQERTAAGILDQARGRGVEDAAAVIAQQGVEGQTRRQGIVKGEIGHRARSIQVGDSEVEGHEAVRGDRIVGEGLVQELERNVERCGGEALKFEKTTHKQPRDVGEHARGIGGDVDADGTDLPGLQQRENKGRWEVKAECEELDDARSGDGGESRVGGKRGDAVGGRIGRGSDDHAGRQVVEENRAKLIHRASGSVVERERQSAGAAERNGARREALGKPQQLRVDGEAGGGDAARASARRQRPRGVLVHADNAAGDIDGDLASIAGAEPGAAQTDGGAAVWGADDAVGAVGEGARRVSDRDLGRQDVGEGDVGHRGHRYGVVNVETQRRGGARAYGSTSYSRCGRTRVEDFAEARRTTFKFSNRVQ